MEDDNEWETIQPSSSSTTQSDNDDNDTVVITTPTNPHNPTTFSPSNHEDTILVSQPTSSYSNSTSSTTSDSAEVTDVELPRVPEVRRRLVNESLRFLSTWGLRVCYGIRSRVGLWSITAFVTVTVYVWWKQRVWRLMEKDSKDKMMKLIKQKDEKIKQLLLQIDRMNEALSARRKVPVFRVVVDSPFVLRPRS